MNRRFFVRLALAGGVWLATTGHSPYRQWIIYRKLRLVVLADAEDEVSVQIGQTLVPLLAERLPESRATLARARDVNDLVRLLATKQLDAAVLREDYAYAAYAGVERFADNGKVPLRALANLGAHLFVCRDDMPQPIAHQIAEAVAENWRRFDPTLVGIAASPEPLRSTRIPAHPGAAEYYLENRLDK